MSSRVANLLKKLEDQHKEYKSKIHSIEYQRGVKFDKVTTHNLDKILHDKIREPTKLRVPTKQEFY